MLDADVEEVDRVWRHALEGDVEPSVLRTVEQLDGEVLLVQAHVQEEGVVESPCSTAPAGLYILGELPAQRVGHRPLDARRGQDGFA